MRASFKRHILLWSAAFGLFAVVADLFAVVTAATVNSVTIHYPMWRFLLLAGVYGLISREAIKMSFGKPLSPAAEVADHTERQPVAINIRDDD